MLLGGKNAARGDIEGRSTARRGAVEPAERRGLATGGQGSRERKISGHPQPSDALRRPDAVYRGEADFPLSILVIRFLHPSAFSLHPSAHGGSNSPNRKL